MVIFHSYVSLPKGKASLRVKVTKHSKEPMGTSAKGLVNRVSEFRKVVTILTK